MELIHPNLKLSKVVIKLLPFVSFSWCFIFRKLLTNISAPSCRHLTRNTNWRVTVNFRVHLEGTFKHFIFKQTLMLLCYSYHPKSCLILVRPLTQCAIPRPNLIPTDCKSIKVFFLTL